MKQYTIQRAAARPAEGCDWSDLAWRDAPALAIDQHRPESNHQPHTQAKVVYDDTHLHVIFKVDDQYVRSVCTERHDNVCRDSCVEFFFAPKTPEDGYFNFELNCGGTMLLFHCKTNADGSFSYEAFDDAAMDQVEIYHSMPNVVDPEIAEPVTWTLRFSAPFSILEPRIADIPHSAGATWQGNFYKCGSDMSHQHWVSWSAIEGKLNFHRQECFGELTFA